MIKTRSAALKEAEEKKEIQDGESQPQHKTLSLPATGPDTGAKALGRTFVVPGSSIKSEQPARPPPLQPVVHSTKGSKSKQSTSSSVRARKMRLELEAAERKAKLQMELIDKKLAADLAELEYSSHEEEEGEPVDVHSEVEKWLDKSQHEFVNAQQTPANGNIPGRLCPTPPPPVTTAGTVSVTDGTIQMLATAIKDLAVASASTNKEPSTPLLSRICTPKDLPSFAGDPMDWLNFKMSYEESTEVCGFSPKENLWRLRKCLHGAAKEAVTALLIGGTSPDLVMSTLEMRFGNPDITASRIVQELQKLPPMSQEYHKDIIQFSVKVMNCVAAVRALGREEHLEGSTLVNLLLTKIPTVLISKWADYSFPLVNNPTKPKLVVLSDFLNNEALKISKTAVNLTSDFQIKRKIHSDYYQPRSHAVLVNNELSDEKCRFCRESKHKLPDCKRFKKSLRKDRWRHVKQFGICYKCLDSRHDKDTCKAPACDKENCAQPHHRLLHYPLTSTNNLRQQNRVNITELQETQPSVETVAQLNVNNKATVLLKVVPIIIHGPSGVIKTAALLDDGSTVTLISAALASRVGLVGNKQSMRVCGAWNNTELVCDSETVNCDVSNKDGTTWSISARSVSDLSLPTQNISQSAIANYKHISSEIQNQLCEVQSQPEMLIGQDNYHLMAPLEIIKGNENEPYLTLTPLGWCIHGLTRSPDGKHSAFHASLLLIDSRASESDRMLHEISEEVRHYFSIDSLGVSNKARQNSDDTKAVKHLEETAILKEGRWYVGLPWKNNDCKLPDSYATALTRLRGVEKKMNANEGYAERYKERIQHLLQNDYAGELKEPERTPKTWYLPHFGVDNVNKRKLRLVFDAASKSSGSSLNDFLLTGPDLLTSLYGIMLRFRENKIAVAGDIKDMFLRVKIHKKYQSALRFLWKDSPNEAVKTYAMTSLIFGANCSPFVAQFIKNKNALRFQSTSPEAVQAICKSHYVDDYIQSLPDEETAIKLIREISNIHKQGGFEIRNWMSNSKNVITSLPQEDLASKATELEVGGCGSERTLGLLWYPKEDKLGFDVSFKRIPECLLNGEKKPTKREILRIVMSIFDVYGFLSPFTIKGKVILQLTWKCGLGWDDVIPDVIHKKWISWLEHLKQIHAIRLPRYYQDQQTTATPTATSLKIEQQHRVALVAPNQTATPLPPHIDDSDSRSVPTEKTPTQTSYKNLQLHIFCDASTQAMCAVAYWRWTNATGKPQLAFISSKCRVAPNKYSSVPRMELQAALMGARLADAIANEHEIYTQDRYLWCDSSTVLHWIRNTARDYKQFVAHRLGEIDELTQITEWRYIPTKMNVADIATRDTCDLSVFDGEWAHGPTFLYEDEDWPTNGHPEVVEEDLELVNLTTTVTPRIELPAIPDPERFSSWLRLLKSTCMVLSFIQRCKKQNPQMDGDLMRRAERLVIRLSQEQSFHEDLKHLKNNGKLPNTSKLLTLTPIIDEHGILRVGGRINAAPGITADVKQPVILDGRHVVARLLVRYYHILAAHGNQETVVNDLKQKYWIIKLRPTVKLVTSKCMVCRIMKASPQPPRMGDLPEARMSHHQRPFTYCGVDLFGPMDVTVRRHREKRYGVLFTCLTIRAIHIEIVNSLTTDSLIMALRRMAARRGWPLHMHSDNGTNLKGAFTEMNRSVQELDQDALKSYAVNYGTTWTFIPPASPHWGGAWERLIRTVKRSLKVVLKERAPRDEVLNTLMLEVEQIVNGRPLTHVNVEPHSDESITPNHFLLGTSSNLPVLGAFDDKCLQKQWRISQALADSFWRRWVREVLPEMRPRTKWQQEQRPLQVGDLVLVIDPDLPRNVWPRGLIKAIIPGKDGRVRLVEVLTKAKVLRRSAARVARISTSE